MLDEYELLVEVGVQAPHLAIKVMLFFLSGARSAFAANSQDSNQWMFKIPKGA